MRQLFFRYITKSSILDCISSKKYFSFQVMTTEWITNAFYNLNVFLTFKIMKDVSLIVHISNNKHLSAHFLA